MDILAELEEKGKELELCYAMIQLQMQTIEELAEKAKHLEDLLMHDAKILELNKE